MKVRDTFVGAGFVGAGALLFAATLGFPPGEPGQPGPALFPRIIGVLMTGFGLALALGGARSHEPTERPSLARLLRSRGFVNALFVIGVVVAYIAVADVLGFLLTGALLTFGLMWRLGVAPAKAAPVAIGFTLVVYVLFYKVLRVPLPGGILWW